MSESGAEQQHPPSTSGSEEWTTTNEAVRDLHRKATARNTISPHQFESQDDILLRDGGPPRMLGDFTYAMLALPGGFRRGHLEGVTAASSAVAPTEFGAGGQSQYVGSQYLRRNSSFGVVGGVEESNALMARVQQLQAVEAEEQQESFLADLRSFWRMRGRLAGGLSTYGSAIIFDDEDDVEGAPSAGDEDDEALLDAEGGLDFAAGAAAEDRILRLPLAAENAKLMEAVRVKAKAGPRTQAETFLPQPPSASAHQSQQAGLVSPGKSGLTTTSGDMSVRATWVCLMKMYCCSAVLYIPKAFENGGIVSSWLIFFLFVATTTVCVVQLFRVREFYATELPRTREATFGDLAQLSMGFRGKLLVDASVFLSQCSFAMSGHVVIAQCLTNAFFDPPVGGEEGDIGAERVRGPAIAAPATPPNSRFFIPFEPLVLIPLVWVRRLSKLDICTLFGDVVIFGILGYLFLYSLVDWTSCGIAHHIVQPAPVAAGTAAMSDGTSIFAFEGIGGLLPVYASMKRPEKFIPLYLQFILVIGVIFCTFGTVIFLAHTAKDLPTNAILTLAEGSFVTNVIYFLYACGVAATYPLLLFPATRVGESYLFPPKYEYRERSGGSGNTGNNGHISGPEPQSEKKWQKNIFRTLIVFLLSFGAYYGAEQLDIFISVLGALFCTPMGLVFPPLMVLAINRNYVVFKAVCFAGSLTARQGRYGLVNVGVGWTTIFDVGYEDGRGAFLPVDFIFPDGISSNDFSSNEQDEHLALCSNMLGGPPNYFNSGGGGASGSNPSTHSAGSGPGPGPSGKGGKSVGHSEQQTYGNTLLTSSNGGGHANPNSSLGAPGGLIQTTTSAHQAQASFLGSVSKKELTRAPGAPGGGKNNDSADHRHSEVSAPVYNYNPNAISRVAPPNQRPGARSVASEEEYESDCSQFSDTTQQANANVQRRKYGNNSQQGNYVATGGRGGPYSAGAGGQQHQQQQQQAQASGQHAITQTAYQQQQQQAFNRGVGGAGSGEAAAEGQRFVPGQIISTEEANRRRLEEMSAAQQQRRMVENNQPRAVGSPGEDYYQNYRVQGQEAYAGYNLQQVNPQLQGGASGNAYGYNPASRSEAVGYQQQHLTASAGAPGHPSGDYYGNTAGLAGNYQQGYNTYAQDHRRAQATYQQQQAYYSPETDRGEEADGWQDEEYRRAREECLTPPGRSKEPASQYHSQAVHAMAGGGGTAHSANGSYPYGGQYDNSTGGQNTTTGTSTPYNASQYVSNTAPSAAGYSNQAAQQQQAYPAHRGGEYGAGGGVDARSRANLDYHEQYSNQQRNRDAAGAARGYGSAYGERERPYRAPQTHDRGPTAQQNGHHDRGSAPGYSNDASVNVNGAPVNDRDRRPFQRCRVNQFREVEMRNDLVEMLPSQLVQKGADFGMNMLPEIPVRFEKGAYTATFIPYLMEECRAHLSMQAKSTTMHDLLKAEVKMSGRGRRSSPGHLNLDCEFLGDAVTMMDQGGRDFGWEEGNEGKTKLNEAGGVAMGEDGGNEKGGEKEGDDGANEKGDDGEKVDHTKGGSSPSKRGPEWSECKKDFDNMWCLNDVCVMIPKAKYDLFVQECINYGTRECAFQQGYFDFERLGDGPEDIDAKQRDALHYRCRSFCEFLAMMEEREMLCLTVTVAARVERELIVNNATTGEEERRSEHISRLGLHVLSARYRKLLNEQYNGGGYNGGDAAHGGNDYGPMYDQGAAFGEFFNVRGVAGNARNAGWDYGQMRNQQPVVEDYVDLFDSGDDKLPPEIAAGQGSVFVLMRLSNIITHLRIARALENKNGENCPFFEKELSGYESVGETQEVAQRCRVFKEEREDALDRSQNEMVNKALTKEAGLTLVHGPPGTGKTRATVWLLLCLSKTEDRILACGPTNQSVEELAAKFMNNWIVRKERRSRKKLLSPFDLSEEVEVEDFSRELLVASRGKINVHEGPEEEDYGKLALVVHAGAAVASGSVENASSALQALASARGQQDGRDDAERKKERAEASRGNHLLKNILVYERSDALVWFLMQVATAIEDIIQWQRRPLDSLLSACKEYVEKHKNKIDFGNITPAAPTMRSDGRSFVTVEAEHLAAKAVIRKGKLANVIDEFLVQPIVEKLWEERKALEPHIPEQPQHVQLKRIRRALEEIWPSGTAWAGTATTVGEPTLRRKWNLISAWRAMGTNIITRLRDPARRRNDTSAAAASSGAAGNGAGDEEDTDDGTTQSWDIATEIFNSDSTKRLKEQFGGKPIETMFHVAPFNRGFVDLDGPVGDLNAEDLEEDDGIATIGVSYRNAVMRSAEAVAAQTSHRASASRGGKNTRGGKKGKGRSDASGGRVPRGGQTNRFLELRKTLGAKSFVGTTPMEVSNRVQKIFLEDATLVFCTVAVGGRQSLIDLQFSCLVIDESGMVPEAESSIVLKDSLRRVILVGDPKQLRATVQSQINMRCKYDRSLMERLMLCNNFPAHKLVVEYRMEQDISWWPNQQYYDGELLTAEAVRARERDPILLSTQDLYEANHTIPTDPRKMKKGAVAGGTGLGDDGLVLGTNNYNGGGTNADEATGAFVAAGRGPGAPGADQGGPTNSIEQAGKTNCFQTLVWIDTANLECKRETRSEARSILNAKEGDLIIDHLVRFNRNVGLELYGKAFKAPKKKDLSLLLSKYSIGITSPYAAQVALLQELIRVNFGIRESDRLKVRSIDGFQGGEADVMLISTVRSNEKGNIGFCDNDARLNVAITRARKALHIFGDSHCLSRGADNWKSYIEYLRNADPPRIFDLAAREQARLIDKDITGKTKAALQLVEQALEQPTMSMALNLHMAQGVGLSAAAGAGFRGGPARPAALDGQMNKVHMPASMMAPGATSVNSAVMMAGPHGAAGATVNLATATAVGVQQPPMPKELHLNRLRFWVDETFKAFRPIFSEFALRFFTAANRTFKERSTVGVALANLMKGQEMIKHSDHLIKNGDGEELVDAAAEHLHISAAEFLAGVAGTGGNAGALSNATKNVVAALAGDAGNTNREAKNRQLDAKSLNKKATYDQAVDILWHVQIDFDTGAQVIVVWNIVFSPQFKTAREAHKAELRRFKTEYLRDCLVRKEGTTTGSGSAGGIKGKGGGKKGAATKVDKKSATLIEPHRPVDPKTGAAKYPPDYDPLRALGDQQHEHEEEGGMNIIGISRTKLYDEAVSQPSSIFVHGRAGTGKTQVLVARGYVHQTQFLAAEVAHKMKMEQEDKLRKEQEERRRKMEEEGSTSTAALEVNSPGGAAAASSTGVSPAKAVGAVAAPAVAEPVEPDFTGMTTLERLRAKQRFMQQKKLFKEAAEREKHAKEEAAEKERRRRERAERERELERQRAKDANPVRLVLFVTASPTLAMQVKKCYDGLIENFIETEKAKARPFDQQFNALKDLNAKEMEKLMLRDAGDTEDGRGAENEGDADGERQDDVMGRPAAGSTPSGRAEEDESSGELLDSDGKLSDREYDEAFEFFSSEDEKTHFFDDAPVDLEIMDRGKDRGMPLSTWDKLADAVERDDNGESVSSSKDVTKSSSKGSSSKDSVEEKSRVEQKIQKKVSLSVSSTTPQRPKRRVSEAAAKEMKLGTSRGRASGSVMKKSAKEQKDEEELAAAYAEASVGIGFAPLTPAERQREVERMPKTFEEIAERSEFSAASLITNYTHFLQVLDRSIDDDEDFFEREPDDGGHKVDAEVNFRRFQRNYYESLSGLSHTASAGNHSGGNIASFAGADGALLPGGTASIDALANASASSLPRAASSSSCASSVGYAGNIGLKEAVRGVAAVPDASQLFKEFHIIKGDYPPEEPPEYLEEQENHDNSPRGWTSNIRTTAHRMRSKMMEGKLSTGKADRAKDKYGKRHVEHDARVYKLQKDGLDNVDENLAAEALARQRAVALEKMDPYYHLRHIGQSLTREQYVNHPPGESLLEKASKQDREKVYNAFKKYEQHKQDRGDWDMNDVVCQIWGRVQFLRARQRQGYDGPLVSCLLSDESQDLSILQMLLFALVCRDPNAYTFAHDPAQCIAEGRVFKHARLKDLWHGLYPKVLSDKKRDTEEAEWQRAAEAIKKNMPKEIHLTRNFRAPQRILNMAQVLVEVSKHFYPKRIDDAAPERSYEKGELPTFIVGVTPQQFRDALLSAGVTGGGDSKSDKSSPDLEKKTSGEAPASASAKKTTSSSGRAASKRDANKKGAAKVSANGGPASADKEGSSAPVVEDLEEGKGTNANAGITTFGADQVVLVGDDEAKRQVDALLGDRGIVVLLPSEAKGLEFNDVIIWNMVGRSNGTGKSNDGEREDKVWTELFKFLRGCANNWENDSATVAGKALKLSADSRNMDSLIDGFEKKIMKNKTGGSFSNSTNASAFQEATELWNTRLKELIVCITRAKKRLIIYEEDETITATRMFKTLYHDAPMKGLPLSKRRGIEMGTSMDGSALIDGKDGDIEVVAKGEVGASAEVKQPTGLARYRGNAARKGPHHDPLASDQVREPLVSLVESVTDLNETEAVVDFPRKSSKQEYVRRGLEYFNNEQFVEAERMYRVGGNLPLAFWSKAAHAEQSARDVGANLKKLDAQSLKQRAEHYTAAAQMYYQVWHLVFGGGGSGTTKKTNTKHKDNGMGERALRQAALAFTNADQHEQAASSYELIATQYLQLTSDDTKALYQAAGESYLKALKWGKAGDCFKRAENHEQALKMYRNGKLWSQALNYFDAFVIPEPEPVGKDHAAGGTKAKEGDDDDNYAAERGKVDIVATFNKACFFDEEDEELIDLKLMNAQTVAKRVQVDPRVNFNGDDVLKIKFQCAEVIEKYTGSDSPEFEAFLDENDIRQAYYESKKDFRSAADAAERQGRLFDAQHFARASGDAETMLRYKRLELNREQNEMRSWFGKGQELKGECLRILTSKELDPVTEETVVDYLDKNLSSSRLAAAEMAMVAELIDVGVKRGAPKLDRIKHACEATKAEMQALWREPDLRYFPSPLAQFRTTLYLSEAFQAALKVIDPNNSDIAADTGNIYCDLKEKAFHALFGMPYQKLSPAAAQNEVQTLGLVDCLDWLARTIDQQGEMEQLQLEDELLEELTGAELELLGGSSVVGKHNDNHKQQSGGTSTRTTVKEVLKHDFFARELVDEYVIAFRFDANQNSQALIEGQSGFLELCQRDLLRAEVTVFELLLQMCRLLKQSRPSRCPREALTGKCSGFLDDLTLLQMSREGAAGGSKNTLAASIAQQDAMKKKCRCPFLHKSDIGAATSGSGDKDATAAPLAIPCTSTAKQNQFTGSIASGQHLLPESSRLKHLLKQLLCDEKLVSEQQLSHEQYEIMKILQVKLQNAELVKALTVGQNKGCLASMTALKEIVSKTTESLEPVFNPVAVIADLAAPVVLSADKKKQFHAERARELYNSLTTRSENVTLSELCAWNFSLRSSGYQPELAKQFADYAAEKNNRIWSDTFLFVFFSKSANAPSEWKYAKKIEGVYSHEAKDRYFLRRDRNVIMTHEKSDGQNCGRWVIKDRNTVLMFANDPIRGVVRDDDDDEEKEKENNDKEKVDAGATGAPAASNKREWDDVNDPGAALDRRYKESDLSRVRWRIQFQGHDKGEQYLSNETARKLRRSFYVVPDGSVKHLYQSMEIEMFGQDKGKREMELQYTEQALDKILTGNSNYAARSRTTTGMTHEKLDDMCYYATRAVMDLLEKDTISRDSSKKFQCRFPLSHFITVCSPEGFLTLLERAAVWNLAVCTKLFKFAIARSLWCRHFLGSENLFWPLFRNWDECMGASFEGLSGEEQWDRQFNRSRTAIDRLEQLLDAVLHYLRPANDLLDDCTADERSLTVLEVWCRRKFIEGIGEEGSSWGGRSLGSRGEEGQSLTVLTPEQLMKVETQFAQVNFRYFLLLFTVGAVTARTRRYLASQLANLPTSIRTRHARLLPPNMVAILKDPANKAVDSEERDTRKDFADKTWSLDQVTPKIHLDLIKPRIGDEILNVERPYVKAEWGGLKPLKQGETKQVSWMKGEYVLNQFAPYMFPEFWPKISGGALRWDQPRKYVLLAPGDEDAVWQPIAEVDRMYEDLIRRGFFSSRKWEEADKEARKISGVTDNRNAESVLAGRGRSNWWSKGGWSNDKSWAGTGGYGKERDYWTKTKGYGWGKDKDWDETQYENAYYEKKTAWKKNKGRKAAKAATSADGWTTVGGGKKAFGGKNVPDPAMPAGMAAGAKLKVLTRDEGTSAAVPGQATSSNANTRGSADDMAMPEKMTAAPAVNPAAAREQTSETNESGASIVATRSGSKKAAEIAARGSVSATTKIFARCWYSFGSRRTGRFAAVGGLLSKSNDLKLAVKSFLKDREQDSFADDAAMMAHEIESLLKCVKHVKDDTVGKLQTAARQNSDNPHTLALKQRYEHSRKVLDYFLKFLQDDKTGYNLVTKRKRSLLTMLILLCKDAIMHRDGVSLYDCKHADEMNLNEPVVPLFESSFKKVEAKYHKGRAKALREKNRGLKAEMLKIDRVIVVLLTQFTKVLRDRGRAAGGRGVRKASDQY
eukprot:g1837.t1